ncbi:hypothetical protein AMECASPLE_010530 [Ameca splendens]|uniref:Uncharacterized protein n=1 Tax=Ameca splendens TaxID=208324 RepID=A0ABV0ZL26_9TELE
MERQIEALFSVDSWSSWPRQGETPSWYWNGFSAQCETAVWNISTFKPAEGTDCNIWRWKLKRGERTLHVEPICSDRGSKAVRRKNG